MLGFSVCEFSVVARLQCVRVFSVCKFSVGAGVSGC
jgi:hypothetical protein